MPVTVRRLTFCRSRADRTESGTAALEQGMPGLHRITKLDRCTAGSPDGHLETGRGTPCSDGIVLADVVALLDKQPNGMAFPRLITDGHAGSVPSSSCVDG